MILEKREFESWGKDYYDDESKDLARAFGIDKKALLKRGANSKAKPEAEE